MADTTSVSSESEFVTAVGDAEESELTETAREVLYEIWQDFSDEHHPDAHVILIPDWFSEKELDARRPVLFGTIEHDDPDSGAVLFANVHIVDISTVENDAYAFVSLEDSVDELDISDEDEYIDEPGLFWVPRKLMSLYEHE